VPIHSYVGLQIKLAIITIASTGLYGLVGSCFLRQIKMMGSDLFLWLSLVLLVLSLALWLIVDQTFRLLKGTALMTRNFPEEIPAITKKQMLVLVLFNLFLLLTLSFRFFSVMPNNPSLYFPLLALVLPAVSALTSFVSLTPGNLGFREALSYLAARGLGLNAHDGVLVLLRERGIHVSCSLAVLIVMIALWLWEIIKNVRRKAQ